MTDPREQTTSLETKPVEMFIDGRHLAVDAGMTVLEAAQANGIDIPTLCHDPRLEPVGRCGLCVVDAGGPGLVQACETPVSAEVGGRDPESGHLGGPQAAAE